VKRHILLPAALAVNRYWPAARAAVEVGVYGGQTYVPDTDVEYRADVTRVTLHDVSWETRPFENPIYYGLRVSYWTERNANLGFSLDFAHPKIYADPNQVVRVTGQRDGAAVDGQEPVGNTLQSFNNSHGLNMLTVNVLYRWNTDAAGATGALQRLQPYVGLGAGVAFPHVEAVVAGARTYEYQLAGPAVQAQLGLGYPLGGGFGLFSEYKYNRAWLDESLEGGGSLRLEPQVHQFILGVSYAF
jgi:lipid A oxidase